jgi:hypothetical protein
MVFFPSNKELRAQRPWKKASFVDGFRIYNFFVSRLRKKTHGILFLASPKEKSTAWNLGHDLIIN